MTNDDYLSLQNFIYAYEERWTFLVAQMVKNLPAMQDTWTQSPSQEDFLEKEIATHSSTPAWRNPWTKEPGKLQSMESQRIGHK